MAPISRCPERFAQNLPGQQKSGKWGHILIILTLCGMAPISWCPGRFAQNLTGQQKSDTNLLVGCNAAEFNW